MDPIADEFAWVSTYNYAENEPVAHIDLHGLQALDYSAKFQKGNGIQLNEKSSRIAKDVFTIAGGALLIAGTGGSASPLIVAGGTLGGTYGMASGTAQLVTDARGDFEKSDAIPETAAGFLAQPIDKALGSENRLAEKSADLVQNLFTGTNPNTTTEGIVGAEQVVDAAVGLKNEVARVEGQSSASPAKRGNRPAKSTTPFSDVTVKKVGREFSNNFQAIKPPSNRLSSKDVKEISSFLERED